MNVLALVPFLVFTTLLIKSIKKKLKPAIVLFSFYTIGSFISVILDLKIAIPDHDANSDNFINFFAFSSILALFLSFSFNFKPFLAEEELLSFKKATFFFSILVILAFFSFSYQLPYAIKSMLSNPIDIRVELKTGEYSALPKGVLTTIATGISSFYVIFIFFFYLSLVQKRSFFITLSMFIGVLSYVVSTFAFAGRDGIVFIILLFLIVFFLFEKLLDRGTRKKIKILYLTLMGIGFMFMFTITVNRFMTNDGSVYKTLNHGVFGYLGMQPFIFSDYLNYFDNYTFGAKNFSVFRDVLGLNSIEIPLPKSIIEWQFGSFLSSFYKPNGLSSLIFFSLFFVLLFLKTSFNNYKRFFLQRIIITGFYFQFMITGWFYFKLGNPGGNKYMILLLFFYFVLSLKNKFQKRIR